MAYVDYEKQAEELVRKICRHFGIPPPRVKYDPTMCHGHIACYYKGTIYFATPEAINETVALHELLHYALDLGYATYTCETCGSPLIVNGRNVECYVCHEKYEVVDKEKKYPGGGIEDVLLGIAIGTFFVAPFIYVPAVRSWAVEKVSKGLGIAKRRVEEALKK